MSDDDRDIAIDNYVYWLCNNMPLSFYRFMKIWVKVVMFINQIPYEQLLNRDGFKKLTDEFFEQEVELY